MKRMFRGAALLTLLFLSGCKLFPVVESEADPSHRPPRASIAAIKYVGYPQQGVLLAQGWDSLRQRPANNICVAFGESMIPGHDIDIRFSEIFSREQLNKAMSLAASASYSGFGASISAQANFSNSLSIDRTSQNILATIEVLKGDQFVAPSLSGAHADPVRWTRDGFTSVQLTEQARALLISGNLRAFQSMCGDSYVSHIRRGGKLHAYLTFSDLTREAREAMSFSLSASGWGAQITGNKTVDQVQKSQDKITNIRIFQSGGPLQPAPVNTTEFYQTVRQFLTTTDPDLFPTKPFEIGLVRYDALPNWDSTAKVSDPEGLRDLITLYWLFDDLRKQYTNALTSSDQYLMFQPEAWSTLGNYFAYFGGQLCKVTYDAASKKWTSAQTQKGCDVDGSDVIGDNAWALSNILGRLDRIVGHGEELRRAIEKCLVDPRNCTTDSALAATRASIQQGMTKTLATTTAKEFDRVLGAEPGSKEVLREMVASLAWLPSTASESELVAQINTSKKKIVPAQEGKEHPLVTKLSTPEGMRELHLVAKAKLIEFHLEDLAKGTSEQSASAGLRTFFAPMASETKLTIAEYVKEYYQAAILSPIRIKSGGSLLKEFENVYSTDEAVINKNAAAVRESIRRNIILDQIRFAESYCAADGGSALCKPVTWIRKLMDETEIGPIFAQNSRQSTVVVGSVRKCEDGWFSRGSIWWKKCWNEAVTQSVTDFITEFADTHVRL